MQVQKLHPRHTSSHKEWKVQMQMKYKQEYLISIIIIIGALVLARFVPSWFPTYVLVFTPGLFLFWIFSPNQEEEDKK